jgi:UDP-2-acetamido-3-amino-2,3-dideoxy-glucuronate N-acetyltransferase
MSQPMGYFKHPTALVESDQIGAGTRVWAFAHIMGSARIGAHCNICDHVFVESFTSIGSYVTVKNGVAVWDGVTLEDFVFVGPNVAFTNDKKPRSAFKKPREQFLQTLIRQGASLGANSTIIGGVTIGRRAFVGAGAVVTKNVPDYGLVVGNPARLIGYVCECGERLPANLECKCGYRYERYKDGLAELTSAAQAGSALQDSSIEVQS